MIQVKNLDQISIPGEGTNLSKEILNKLTCEYMNLDLSAKGDFGAVPENEFAKVVIQFAEPRTRKTERKKTLKKIVPSATGKDGVLWILGLEGFYHLFTSKGEDKFYSEIIKDLETTLNGTRDYVDRINNENIVVLQKSQNEREGIRTLLNTSVPILTSEYLSLHDPAYKKHYPKEFKQIEAKLIENGLNNKVNEMQIIGADKKRISAPKNRAAKRLAPAPKRAAVSKKTAASEEIGQTSPKKPKIQEKKRN